MALYSVYVRPSSSGRDALKHEKVHLIKAGFSWLAFLFPVVWLLINRVWRWFLIVLALEIGIAILIEQTGLPGWILIPAGLTMMAYVGISARDWLGAALERRGFKLMATNIAAESEDEAYAAFVRRPKPRSTAVAEAKPVKPAETVSVIGLFPNPEGRP